MKILLCGGGLYPRWSPRKMLEVARELDYDGVEFFLFGEWTVDDVDDIKNYAADRGLIAHFHQVWSKEESSDAAAKNINKLLHLLGRIPDDDYELDQIVPYNATPLVAYANYMFAPMSEMWIQTLSTGFGTPKLPYKDFVSRYKENPFPVVFDTTHFLEYALGKHGVSNLARMDVVGAWLEGWKTFGTTVKEIHFNDYDPSRGDKKGRNILLRPNEPRLQAFASIVKETGWHKSDDHFIVSEFRWDEVWWSKEKLLELRYRIDKYFI